MKRILLTISAFGLVSLAKLPMFLLPAISYPTLPVRIGFEANSISVAPRPMSGLPRR